MTANVESMMYAGETPWHGLGTKVEEGLTWEQALRASGLDWSVSAKPLAIKERLVAPELYPAACPDCGSPVKDWADRRGCSACDWTQDLLFVLGADVPMARAVVRSTDSRVLGVVGPDWTPLQNVDAFRWFDPLVENGFASYHTAGSLHQGEVVWVLARIGKEDAQVGSDSIRKFVLLSNSHRGGVSARIGFTPICVVCSNTLKMAHGDDASRLIRVPHTSSVKENLEVLRDVMNLANQEFEATAAQFRVLLSTDIVEADLRRYVRSVFFTEEQANDDKLGKRTIDKVVELFEGGRGAAERGHNVWRAYQAITEYLTWGRGKEADTRLASAWFGDSSKLNTRALLLALRLAERGSEGVSFVAPGVDVGGMTEEEAGPIAPLSTDGSAPGAPADEEVDE